MKNINKRLKDLQPYVLSIRFPSELSVVDIYVKEGWTIPKSDLVGHESIPQKPNFYMLYPLMTDGNVGVNELLDYVDELIKDNLEKEEKIDLLKVRVKELQKIFLSSSLQVCQSLQFTYSDDNNKLSGVDNITLNNDIKITLPKVEPDKVSKSIEGAEKKEITSFKVGNEIIDLPPKKNEKIVLEEFTVPEIVCKCGPNEVCPICEEEKMG